MMFNPGGLAVGLGVGLCVWKSLSSFSWNFHHQGEEEERHVLNSLRPLAKVDTTGHLEYLETFGAYVVRQVGLPEKGEASDRLDAFADEYMRADNNARGAIIQRFFGSDAPAEFYDEVDNELQTCIISYLGFHWRHSATIIEQVAKGTESKNKFRNSVAKATREKRFKKVLSDLEKTREWGTLVELAKAVRQSPPPEDEMVTAVPHHQRPPVLLLVGGGMGAGKSTAVKEFVKSRCFWRQVIEDAVVVEADAFKEKDVVYHTLSRSRFSGNDADSIAEFVHESSTKAASSLLVSALNEGRDVIFDGTLSWAPFVKETIAMARDVHTRPYRIVRESHRFQTREDGVVEERYWEPIDMDESEGDEEGGSGPKATAEPPLGPESPGNDTHTPEGPPLGGLPTAEDGGRGEGKGDRGLEYSPKRLDSEHSEVGGSGGTSRSSSGKARRLRREFPPYRIELLGVECDAPIAVARGIRRAVLVGRGVPIERQLRSHRLFAESLETYTELVDSATLYCTNQSNSLQVIAVKESGSRLLKDPQEYPAFERLAKIYDKAGSALELHKTPAPPMQISLLRPFTLVQKITSTLSHIFGHAADCGVSASRELTPWEARALDRRRSSRQALLKQAFLKVEAK